MIDFAGGDEFLKFNDKEEITSTYALPCMNGTVTPLYFISDLSGNLAPLLSDCVAHLHVTILLC